MNASFISRQCLGSEKKNLEFLEAKRYGFWNMGMWAEMLQTTPYKTENEGASQGPVNSWVKGTSLWSKTRSKMIDY